VHGSNGQWHSIFACRRTAKLFGLARLSAYYGDEHEELVEQARKLSLPLFSRFEDYYQKAVIHEHEIGEFLTELVD